uniref:Uncharacterized protein n=1 Tax=Caenorhabditis japonica TaxID=281687 RepID=A0A8R1HPY5_CAEJA
MAEPKEVPMEGEKLHALIDSSLKIKVGDESWVIYNNDTHRAAWIPRGEEPPVQPKANLHEKKCLLSCFWDAKGMLYYELLPQGRMVEKSVRDAPLSASSMTTRAKATQAKLQELNWDTVTHPPNSSDIAPSDYHLFRPQKLFLKEKRFAKYEDLKMAVGCVLEEGHRRPPRAMAHSCD